MSKSRPAWQAASLCGKAVFLVALFMLGLTLTACGKKAARVDAPPDLEDDQFPRTYPDPATDPKPVPVKPAP